MTNTVTEFLLARVAESEDIVVRDCEARRHAAESQAAAVRAALQRHEELFSAFAIISALVAVYTDHPDYDPTWSLS